MGIFMTLFLEIKGEKKVAHQGESKFTSAVRSRVNSVFEKSNENINQKIKIGKNFLNSESNT